MGFEAGTNGLGVSAFYGPMSQREGIEGHRRTEGTIQEFVVYLTGENVNNNVFDRTLAFLPEGATPKEVYVDVVEAFSGAGSIDIGESGTEATNGVNLSNANITSTGSFVVSSFNGTYAGRLDSYSDVSVAPNGSVSGGYAQVTVRYYSG